MPGRNENRVKFFLQFIFYIACNLSLRFFMSVWVGVIC